MAAKSFPILFVAPVDVGDAVLASGLLKKLHDEAPNPHFTIIANPAVAPLFADFPKLDQLVVTQKPSRSSNWFGLFGRRRARAWALVVDVPARVITGALRPKQKALRRSGEEPVHKVIEAARLLRLEEEPPAPYLFVSEERQAHADALIAGEGPILAMAPAAAWAGKAWPAERFAEVARRLMAANGPLAGGRLMILGEAGEMHATEAVRAAAPRDRCIDLVGKADPLTVFAALKRVRLFIGGDTGFMHLAAAADAPTLGLFGPSDDRIGSPWVLRHGPCAARAAWKSCARSTLISPAPCA